MDGKIFAGFVYICNSEVIFGIFKRKLYSKLNMTFIMKSRLSSFAGAAFCALTLAVPALADAPAGYYNSLEGKTGTELMKAVKTVGFKNHKTISYGDQTWVAFKKTDVRIVNGRECWWDMYSSNNVAVSSGHPGMNIEHSVANSWWDGTKNDAYKDIVHLNPSDATANNRKGNFPLGEISDLTWDNGVTFVGKPVSGQGGGSGTVYEPHDDYKGDFARVFMYMFTIYKDMAWGTRFTWMYDTSSDLMLKPWAYQLLLKWSAADPVSQKERDRNDGIAVTQGNRNPFIDLPDLAEYIWGSKLGQPYHVDGAHNPDPIDPDPIDPDPVDPDPVDPDPVDPTPEDPSLTPGTYVLVASQSDIRAGESYLILGSKSHVAMSLTQNKNKTYFEPTATIDIDGNIISEAPSDAALITLEAQGDGYALKASDLAGNQKGYLFSSSEKTINLTDYSTTQGVKAKLTYSSQGVAVVYGASASSGSGALYYNKSATRFTTYNSNGQERLDFYRKVKETSGVEEVEEIDDSCLVEVWGNNILVPDGASIYDLNGRKLINGENLARGIYLVASPTFRKTVKVMIK